MPGIFDYAFGVLRNWNKIQSYSPHVAKTIGESAAYFPGLLAIAEDIVPEIREHRLRKARELLGEGAVHQQKATPEMERAARVIETEVGKVVLREGALTPDEEMGTSDRMSRGF